jgi:hypothetical protein
MADYPRGRYPAQWHYGNISLAPDTPPGPKLICDPNSEKLIPAPAPAPAPALAPAAAQEWAKRAHWVGGTATRTEDVFAEAREWIEKRYPGAYSRDQVAAELARRFPVGPVVGLSGIYYGNLSLTRPPLGHWAPPLVLDDGILRPKPKAKPEPEPEPKPKPKPKVKPKAKRRSFAERTAYLN